MSNQHLTISGSWLDAIGQLFSSIGKTVNLDEEREIFIKVIAIGEGIQALGNSLQAIAEDNPIGEIGDWIEAAGAATSSLAYSQRLIEGEQRIEHHQLEVLGDSFQSLGPAIQALVEEDDAIIFSLKLQSIGAGIEAIAATHEIHGVEGAEILSAIGSWIQTTGAVLQAILVTKAIEKPEIA